MTTKSLRSIYQLKITLNYIQPPVWRRLLIASTANLQDVHMALQITLGWTNSHLHEFIVGRSRYGMHDDEFLTDTLNEAGYRLDQLLKKENDTLVYLYDFGDSWEHMVVLEKILPFETKAELPRCIEGARACPPDDVGGIPGYEMFLEAVGDPAHPEYEAMLEWVGGGFDAEHFDLAETNDLLREYCK